MQKRLSVKWGILQRSEFYRKRDFLAAVFREEW